MAVRIGPAVLLDHAANTTRRVTVDTKAGEFGDLTFRKRAVAGRHVPQPVGSVNASRDLPEAVPGPHSTDDVGLIREPARALIAPVREGMFERSPCSDSHNVKGVLST